MSTAQAIAAVTKSLHKVVMQAVEDAKMHAITSSQPPDTIDSQQNGNRVNVFLYHLKTNAAWRNRDNPRQVRRGEEARPLLPLCLYYLITAYGEDAADAQEADWNAHTLLGYVMRRLHSRPLLTAEELQAEKHAQCEAVRITLEPLSLDEITRLWSSFQTPFRPSVVYELSPLLIEHELTPTAALPVLNRGAGDRGWDVEPALRPQIEWVQYVPQRELDEILSGRRKFEVDSSGRRKFGARRDNGLAIFGKGLGAISGQLRVELRHKSVREHVAGVTQDLAYSLAVERLNPNLLAVELSSATDADYPPGEYELAVCRTSATGRSERTRAALVAIVPEIVEVDVIRVNEAGQRYCVITFAPPLRDGQWSEARVIIGERTFVPHQAGANELLLYLTGDPPESACYARLRIGVVESLLYDPDRPATAPAEYLDTLLLRAAE